MSTPHWTSRIDIDAAADQVWTVLADVEQWPSWTPTMTSVEPDGPLAIGSKAKVQQPGQRAATYVVTALATGRSFTWQARQIGVVLTAEHDVEARGTGSAVTLGFSVGGVLGPVLRPLLGGKIQGFIDTEAVALKRRVEGS